MHSENLVRKMEDKIVTIKRKILNMIYNSQSGHLGGSFSAADITVCL